MPFPYPTPLGWGAETAGFFGGCSEGRCPFPLQNETEQYGSVSCQIGSLRKRDYDYICNSLS